MLTTFVVVFMLTTFVVVFLSLFVLFIYFIFFVCVGRYKYNSDAGYCRKSDSLHHPYSASKKHLDLGS